VERSADAREGDRPPDSRDLPAPEPSYRPEPIERQELAHAETNAPEPSRRPEREPEREPEQPERSAAPAEAPRPPSEPLN